MLKISCIRPVEWVLDDIGLRFRPWSYVLQDKRNELCGAQLVNLCLILTLSKVFRLQRRIQLARAMVDATDNQKLTRYIEFLERNTFYAVYLCIRHQFLAKEIHSHPKKKRDHRPEF